MTTPSYGGTDPLSTPAEPHGSSTPIGDELAGGAGHIGMDGNDDSAGAVDSAKETASDALSSATEHGSDVVETAKDEASHIASEAKDKATDLLSDVKAQVSEQSRTQLQALASRIGELGDELDGLINGDGSASGQVTDLARQLSERTRSLSSHLAEREPSDLLADVRSFARRKPGTFLMGAAAAGMVAGRLTRGAKQANDEGSQGSGAAATSGAAESSTFATGVPPVSAGVPVGQNAGGRQ